MPYERFFFEGLRPRWVKIRDQWWGELLVTILCLAICGPYIYFRIQGIDAIEGLAGWGVFVVTLAIAVYLIAYTVRDLLRSIHRRSRLIHRRRRITSRSRRQESI